MSKEEDNKAIVGRWFTNFWGKTCNLGIVDELGCFCPRSEVNEALRRLWAETAKASKSGH
jgi:hypothetical protein